MEHSRLRAWTRWVRPARCSVDDQVEAIIEVRETRAEALGQSAVRAASLEQFYDASAPRAYGLAIRLSAGNSVLAEAIVAEAFAAVWQSEPDASKGAGTDLECALLRRVRERCIDAIRGRRRDHECDRSARAPRPETLMIGDAALATPRAVRDDLAALSRDQRTCIERAFFQGQTSSQIVEDISIPKAAVHRAMLSGLRALGARRASTRTGTRQL